MRKNIDRELERMRSCIFRKYPEEVASCSMCPGLERCREDRKQESSQKIITTQKEVKKAHWIPSQVLDMTGLMKAYQCDNCGYKTTYLEYEYCPMCESKMEVK